MPVTTSAAGSQANTITKLKLSKMLTMKTVTDLFSSANDLQLNYLFHLPEKF